MARNMDKASRLRRKALQDFKRTSILEAAKGVFAVHGLEGASIRTIAKEAGYTSGAIYAYFSSKEEIYASILRDSGADLQVLIEAQTDEDPARAFRLKAMEMYRFYKKRPRDLELGLYLARGAGPKGLTPEFNRELNERLVEILGLLGEEMVRICPSLSQAKLKQLVASLYGAIIGIVLLTETKRLKTLGADPDLMMESQIEYQISKLKFSDAKT
jgi:AcrR family transcriptional regulator